VAPEKSGLFADEPFVSRTNNMSSGPGRSAPLALAVRAGLRRAHVCVACSTTRLGIGLPCLIGEGNFVLAVLSSMGIVRWTREGEVVA
jgi:hypothetical protein